MRIMGVALEYFRVDVAGHNLHGGIRDAQLCQRRNRRVASSDLRVRGVFMAAPFLIVKASSQMARQE
jgi:hypothetical protein